MANITACQKLLAVCYYKLGSGLYFNKHSLPEIWKNVQDCHSSLKILNMSFLWYRSFLVVFHAPKNFVEKSWGISVSEQLHRRRVIQGGVWFCPIVVSVQCNLKFCNQVWKVTICLKFKSHVSFNWIEKTYLLMCNRSSVWTFYFVQ